MLQSDGFGPAYRDLARREPVFARLITVYSRPDRSNGTTSIEEHFRSRAGRGRCPYRVAARGVITYLVRALLSLDKRRRATEAFAEARDARCV